MIAMLARKFLLTFFVVLAVFSLLEKLNTRHPPLLVQADYQRCMTVRGPQLLAPPVPAIDRVHGPKDGGSA